MVVLAMAAAWASSAGAAEDDLSSRESEAIRAAVARVAPSVVSIETVGGLERAGRVLFGTGPTTGLVVSEDGYIISSAFNFAQKPASILVGLPDGTRTPARMVATDHSRMLVLLKVNVEDRLTVPEAAPESQWTVGQWAIAVGRTFEGGEPNVSVGIVSATHRIWSKAIQTDAKISPANYGGPLVDVHGRVLGVLVPLSPAGGTSSELAGVEWYDSGIGFAVPLEHVLHMLPRLVSGTDLHPGILGVSLRGGAQHADPAVVAACRPNSPAYKAGLKAGDKIIEVNGQPIERQSQLLNEVHRRYAGDTLRIVALRGEERIECQVELIDHLEPYQRPFLGMLPLRDPTDEVQGVVARYVYPQSPAAKAGIEIGDRLVAVNGQQVDHRDALVARLGELDFAEAVRLAVVRGQESFEVTLQPATEPEAVPAELPPPRGVKKLPDGDRPPVGRIEVKIPGLPNDCLAYVPDDYDPRCTYGVLIWLHAPGGFDDKALVDRWKDLCQRYDLILLAPKAADKARWNRSEIEFVHKAFEDIRARYRVDPLRVVAHGTEAGGAMAQLVAYAQRADIRGVAAVNSPLVGQPPENDPLYRLAFFVTTSRKSRQSEDVAGRVERIRSLKYPVTVVDQGEQGRYLNDDELGHLLRWVDTLDRL